MWMCVRKCVSLCTFISFNQSSDLMRGGKNRWCSYGERYIAFLGGGEEDGYPFCVNTLTVVLIKCYYYISWFTPHSAPFFCAGMAPIKTQISTLSALSEYFVHSFFKKRGAKNNNTSCKALGFWHPTVEKPPFNSHWHCVPPFHNQRTIYCCNSKQSVSNKPHIRKKQPACKRKKLLSAPHKQLRLAGALRLRFYTCGLWNLPHTKHPCHI